MPLRPVRRKGSAVYHVDGSVAGRRFRQSLGTRDRARAEELCAQLEARLWKRAVYGEGADRTFEDAALSYQLAGGERRFLAPLIVHFRGRPLAGIAPGEIRAAAQALYPGASPATWNRQAIAPARAVILHAASLGWCHPIKVEAFATRRPKRVAIGREWMDAFLAQADRDGLTHAAAAMLFLHQSGARIGEAVRVMPEDVDLCQKVIVLARTKEDDWQRRAITDELVVRIANLRPRARPIGERGPAPLFGYASRFTLLQAVRRICRRAGIVYLGSHQPGRHSAATNALDAGFTVREVMDAIGWKTARLVLENYSHSDNAGRRLADTLDGAQPSRSRRRR